MKLPGLLGEGDCAVDVREESIGDDGALPERDPCGVVRSECNGLVAERKRLRVGVQVGGPFGGTVQRGEGPGDQFVGRVRCGHFPCCLEVTCDGDSELWVVEALEVVRDLEMCRVAVVPAEPPVGDFPYHRLDELVLAALGRSRVVVELEDLSLDERSKRRAERLGLDASEHLEPFERERLAEHRGVLDEGSFLGVETIEPSTHDGLQRVGDGQPVE